MTKWKIYNEDAVEWAKNYQKGKFHALLCDAPYHLTSIVKRFGKKDSVPAQFGTDGVYSRSGAGFMGNTWDGGDLAFRPETWEAFGQVLYPGAFGMAFSASRNWHRMAVAIEDAGFVLHPTIFLWAYGQGFPKATRIDTQIDKKEGNIRKDKLMGGRMFDAKEVGDHKSSSFELKNKIPHVIGKGAYNNGTPISDIAKVWEGHRYGLQALKPAVEPIVVFQKPYEGKPLDNIVETGAGTLNIDGGRIPLATDDEYTINTFDDGAKPFGNGAGHKYTTRKVKEDKRLGGNGTWKTDKAAKNVYEGGYTGEDVASSPLGRWPSNLILEQEATQCLDTQTGILTSGIPAGVKHAKNNIYGEYGTGLPVTGIGDSGGASRFFYRVQEQIDENDPVYYCAKVSTKERNAGLEERNVHPTLKPINLCKYLATLLLPPDEYAPRRIFIPFSGSGSEMIGAGQAGWEHIVGVEFDKENGYVDVANKRLEYWLK